MAEAKKKRRVVKQVETVREQANKAQAAPAKERRARRTASIAAKPIRATGRVVAKGARPFSFLLKPFKTRPLRFVGRLLYKILFIGYFRSSWQEVRKVEWPGSRETVKLTFAVFVFAITFGLVVALVDFGLDKVFKQLLLS
ncbi:MAG TPA: preprotein translocase subunit SecE [Verrucomicrobiae bacterium]|nr:preprotein translocase subunit SecE [Verrucomicrobiae bacterium]